MFRSLARQRMSGMWLMSALACLIYSLISSASSWAIVGIIIAGPLEYGLTMYLCKQADEGESKIELLFSGFNRFVETMVAGLLVGLIVMAGLALFVVPGIVAALGLAMTFYIMVDDPNISGIDAMKRSWNMMKGHKGDLFVFYLKFIGWVLLGIITFGVGMYFVTPYIRTAQLYYYRDLKSIQSDFVY